IAPRRGPSSPPHLRRQGCRRSLSQRRSKPDHSGLSPACRTPRARSLILERWHARRPALARLAAGGAELHRLASPIRQRQGHVLAFSLESEDRVQNAPSGILALSDQLSVHRTGMIGARLGAAGDFLIGYFLAVQR